MVLGKLDGDEMVEGGSERRRYARLDLALTVSYAAIDQAGIVEKDPLRAMTADISSGGLRLMTPAPVAPGTKLDLGIFLGEDKKAIKAWGEVIWQRKLSSVSYETGVEIHGVEVGDRQRFMSFIFDQISHIVGGV